MFRVFIFFFFFNATATTEIYTYLHTLSLHASLPICENLLCGAWLCGTVLGTTTMGLHHKLCHTLGGALDLPHAETHSLILPHAIAYNQPGAAAAMHKAGRAMGLNSLAHDLHTLAVSLGVPMAL